MSRLRQPVNVEARQPLDGEPFFLIWWPPSRLVSIEELYLYPDQKVAVRYRPCNLHRVYVGSPRAGRSA